MKYVAAMTALAAGLMLNAGLAEARQEPAPQQGQTAGGAADEADETPGAECTGDGGNISKRAANGMKCYDEGRLGARIKTINELQDVRWKGAPHISDVAKHARSLSKTYARRSGRMQTNLDVSSGAVTLGGSGYLLSAGAGAATQAMWGYGALIPVLAAQFNAHEPTRDLFFGAALGVERIGGRYAAIDSAHAMGVTLRAQSDDLVGKPGDTSASLEGRCAALGGEIERAQHWSREGLDRAVILPDLLAIQEACEAAAAANAALRQHHALIDKWTKLLPQAYAADLLALDANLEQRDYQLRYTPAKTLSGIAAAPFQAASKLLTGEDSKAALDGLKTQDAFQSLDVTLSAIPLPAAPVLAIPKASLSPGSLARGDRNIQRDPKSKAPTAEQVASTLATARETLAALRAVEHQLALETQMANAAVLAARSDKLTFRYDATTRAVTVTLAPTAPPAAAPPAV